MPSLSPDEDSTELRVLRPKLDPKLQQLFHALSDAIQYQFLPIFNARSLPTTTTTIATRTKSTMEDGIRVIQQGRFEMFVECEHKSCQAFEDLCEMMLRPDSTTTPSAYIRRLPNSFDSVAAIREAIVSYAKSAVLMEDRIHSSASSSSSNSVHFGPFSLIISQGIVPNQLPHVDVQPPDFQFGLMITDDCPGTRVYRSKRDIVQTPEDFATFLGISASNNSNHNINSSPTTSNITTVLSRFPQCVRLLQTFGICLSTLNDTDFEISSSLDHVRTGSVLSLPGGILHAGPETNQFRAVLFYTAHTSENKIYHPDVQYFDGLLLGELMLPIWRFITAEDRYSLLQKLHIAVRRYPNLYRHFDNVDPFQTLLHELAVTSSPESVLQTFVDETELSRIPIGYPIQGETLECVSAKHLNTIYEGICHPIVVYRRPNQSVCIQFQSTLEWEGADINDLPYQLIMNRGCRIFNGTNGILTTGSGEQIPCFVSSRDKHPHPQDKVQQCDGLLPKILVVEEQDKAHTTNHADANVTSFPPEAKRYKPDNAGSPF